MGMKWTDLSNNNFRQLLAEWPNGEMEAPNLPSRAQSPNVQLVSKASMARAARASRKAKLAEKRRARTTREKVVTQMLPNMTDNNFRDLLDQWPNTGNLAWTEGDPNLLNNLMASDRANAARASRAPPSPMPVNLDNLDNLDSYWESRVPFTKADMARVQRSVRMAKMAEKRRAARERAVERRWRADARAANTRGARAARMAKMAEKRDPRAQQAAAADKNAQIARALDEFGALLSPPKTPGTKKLSKQPRKARPRSQAPVQQPQPEASLSANNRRRVVEVLSAVKNRRLLPRENWVLQYANHYVKHGYPWHWGTPDFGALLKKNKNALPETAGTKKRDRETEDIQGRVKRNPYLFFETAGTKKRARETEDIQGRVKWNPYLF